MVDINKILKDKQINTPNTGRVIPPSKVIAQDNKLANTGADTRDVQVMFSFNKEAITSTFGPDYIAVNNIVDLADATVEDIATGVITTFRPTTLVNFTYNLFENRSLEGSLNMVDNNDTFNKFMKQSILSESQFTIYICWGYGKNRYHWSSLHQVIINNVSYSLVEGYKLVDVQFQSNPNNEDDMRIFSTQHITVPTKFAVDGTGTLGKDFTGRNTLKVNTLQRSIGSALHSLIRKVARDTYSLGRPFNDAVEVELELIDWDKLNYIKEYQKILKKPDPYRVGPNKTITLRTGIRPKPADIAFYSLTRDIKCLNYHKNTKFNISSGRSYPGGSKYIQEVIINPEDGDPIKVNATTSKELGKNLRRLDRLKKAYAYQKRQRADRSRAVNLGPFGTPFSVGGGDTQGFKDPLLTLKEKIDKLSKEVQEKSKIVVDEKFPVISYDKPAGMAAIPYFEKFIKLLSDRIGIKLDIIFDDTRDHPTVYIGRDVLNHKTSSKLALKSNVLKNLYGDNKGLRRIRSITTTPTPIEDWETQDLNITYNGSNGLVELMTIDIEFVQFFRIANRVYQLAAQPVSQDRTKTVFKVEDFKKSEKELTKIYNAYKTGAETDSKLDRGTNILGTYLDMMGNSSQYFKDKKAKVLVVSIDTNFVSKFTEFLQEERKYINNFIVNDILLAEKNWVNVQVSMVGIPELDQVQNLFYGRIVNLSIIDPVDRENDPKFWLSGKYFIMGIKHKITLSDGYEISMSLYKTLTDSADDNSIQAVRSIKYDT